MAKTMYAIEMNFAHAVRQADELEQIAQSLSVLADSRFQSCLQGISAGWKGENASAFCRKGHVICGNIKRSVSDLRNTAAVIRQIARNTYDTEKRNYETAQIRSYGR